MFPNLNWAAQPSFEAGTYSLDIFNVFPPLSIISASHQGCSFANIRIFDSCVKYANLRARIRVLESVENER